MKSPNSLARVRAQNARAAIHSRARKHDFVQSLLDNQDKLHNFASAQYLEFQNALALIRAIHSTPEIASILAQQQHSSIRRQVTKFAFQCPARVPRKLIRRRQKTGKKGRPAMEVMELDEGEESGHVEIPFNPLPVVPLQAIHQPPTAPRQFQYPRNPQHAVHPADSAVKHSPLAQSATNTEQPRHHQQVVHPVLPTLHQTFSPHAVIATGKPENTNQALNSRVLTINNLLNLQLAAVNEPSHCPRQGLHPAMPVVVPSPRRRSTAIAEKSRSLQQKSPQHEKSQQEIHSTVSPVQTPQQRTPPFLPRPTLPKTTASNSNQPSNLCSTLFTRENPSSSSNLSLPSVSSGIHPKEYLDQSSQHQARLTPPQEHKSRNEPSFHHTEGSLQTQKETEGPAYQLLPVGFAKSIPSASGFDEHDIGETLFSSEGFGGENKEPAYDGTAGMEINGVILGIDGQSSKGSGNLPGNTRRKMLESDLPILFDERMYDTYGVDMDLIRLGGNCFDESHFRNLDLLTNERNSTPRDWFSPPTSPGIFL